METEIENNNTGVSYSTVKYDSLVIDIPKLCSNTIVKIPLNELNNLLKQKKNLLQINIH